MGKIYSDFKAYSFYYLSNKIMFYNYLNTITDNFYEFLGDSQISRQTLKNIKHFLNFKISLKIPPCVHKKLSIHDH